MKEKMKAFIRAQLRVRAGLVAKATVLAVVAALIAVPLTVAIDNVEAQQQTVNTPVSGAYASLNVTGTTTNAGVVVLLHASPVNGAAGGPSGVGAIITGTHVFYGWNAIGSVGTCFVQVFDRGPTTAQVTLGTTVPQAILPVVGVSTGQIQYLATGAFTMNSTLQIAATTTPYGSSQCATNPIVQLFYK